VEISRYQKHGELLKNSVENYPLRDKIVLVLKDMCDKKLHHELLQSHSFHSE
jgi:hypothetical protein